ncbi:MAG: Transglutaminase domain protein [Pedosphaera sp.]|nr:Transglutaminase domain protein [Pedosphaera sp.]
MKRLLLAGLLSVSLTGGLLAQPYIVNNASQLEKNGHFNEAAALLQKSIKAGQASPAELKTLEFELDRLERIRQDYPLTREDLYNQIKASLKDLMPAEFDGWVKSGWFIQREIDGKTLFFNSEPRNIYFRHPELNARRVEPMNDRERERTRLEIVKAIKKASAAEKSPYVLPKTFRVTMDVAADSDAAPVGETVRAWVPIPRRYPFQYDFKLVSSSVKPKAIDAEDSPIRSIYFEQPAVAGKETEFNIQYEYTIRGVHFNLQPDKIQPYGTNDEAVKKFTGEAPHVVFTPEIKALSAKIVGNETNPMLKAKKIYDWLSDNLQYSYALEYSTIRNISDYCRSNCYGDCGQQALLFITLCRYNGVPARWQSGWDLFPKYVSNHDWAEIYLAPYGWMPVDPYVGNYAMRYINTLTSAEKMEIRDFYFGGLDQYRMAANSDHSQPLNPPKDSMRSDDVDFQRGELEHNGKNIYFNQFSYSLRYKVLPETSLP